MVSATDPGLISFAEVSEQLPTHPSRTLLGRWSQKGVRGIKLPTVLVGGKRYTTRQALEEFLTKINEVAHA